VTTMDVKQMMAKHARACARLAQQGPLIVEDVLGSDDFCLMRVGANMFVCFDCELVVVTDTAWPPIKHLHPIELTDDQLQKVHAVLQSSGKWDCVHMLDGTMDELQREVDDYAAMEKLRPVLTPDDWQEWQDIIIAAHRDAQQGTKKAG
jgi:hypothetical protein